MDERVLLVEDDPSIREVTALGLRQAGYRVTTAGDGRGSQVPILMLTALRDHLAELPGGAGRPSCWSAT